ncbi:hypothetical protein EAI_04705 [Harpegnathos saltator]|uniref:Uncharacterized protein n=1 Tax=Harpegnathos saltator TaxID=610380 RepID=E2BTQ5_HARSA|nr:hypothetical protein EAI_04705 [Harpegnathos saltator]
MKNTNVLHKKKIKNTAVQCKKCKKLFFHPGCVSKHRIYNNAQELIKCVGPYDEIKVEREKEEGKEATTRERMGTIGATGSTSRPATTDMKIDWLVRTVKGMKDEVACKKEIKARIREIVN